MDRVQVIGHRGAAGHAPENTLAGFRKAFALGADGVECDIHLSRDGRIVVIHDATLERTTNGQGRVGERTLAELQALDAGAWYGAAFAGERIPTLADVIGIVREADGAQGPAHWLYVELKHGNDVYPGIEEALVLELAGSGLADRVGVISFDHRAISRIRARMPGLRTGILYEGRFLDSARLAKAAGAALLGPSATWVDAEEVAQARLAGLGIFVWTANQDEVMRRVLGLGVTAIGSDYPDRLCLLREEASFSVTNPFWASQTRPMPPPPLG